MYNAYILTLTVLKGMAVILAIVAIPTTSVFFLCSFIPHKCWPLIAICLAFPINLFALFYAFEMPYIQKFFQLPGE